MLFIAFITAFLDVIISTILLCHGNEWHRFPDAFKYFDYKESFLDLWYLSIIRLCIVFGCIIGLLCNKDSGQTFMKKSIIISIVITVSLAVYGCAKLLVYSEQPVFINGGTNVYWFFAIFGWSEIACIYPIILWDKLSSYSFQPTTVEVNDVTEHTPLLHNSINEPTTTTESTETNDSSSIEEKKDEENEKDSKKKSFTELVNKATIGRIVSYTKHEAALIIPALFFLVGAAVAEVFIPLYTGKVISGIAIDQDTNKFIKNILIMGLISIAASICAGCRGGLMMTAINRLNIRVKNLLFESLSKQEIGYFDKTKTGEVLSRLTSDTTTMSTAVGLNFNVFLRSTVKAIGTIVFMFMLSWRLSIVTFMGLPLVVFVSKAYGNYYKKLQTEVQDKLALANEVAEEVCSSMKTVRSFANERGERKCYDVKLQDVYKVQIKQAIAYAGYMWSNEISSLALITGTLGYGGHLVITDLMSSHNLIAFILYQLNLGDCLESIGSVYTGLMQALGAAEKVFRIIDRKPDINIESGDCEPDDIIGHVKFNQVDFYYPSRPKHQVLKNVTFEAKPGQVTALVGPSGGGKTSCVNLLQHFYEPSNGFITIDDIPVNQFEHKYLHEKVTMVGQEPVLFSRTISENISYGIEDQNVTQQDVVQAAMDANAHQFITELPDQYKTETGEKGAQLSGGQKQRVAIARALVRKPRIILLDEATSALDTESEYLVQQAMRQNFKNKTVIVIAHRLSTVEHANKIVVIDKGEVKEQGTHSELMEKNGMYYKLVYRQLHGNENSPKSPNKKKKLSKKNQDNNEENIATELDQLSSLALSLASSVGSQNSFPGSYKSTRKSSMSASSVASSSGMSDIPNL